MDHGERYVRRIMCRDGGLAHEIDAREIPEDWKTGYTPLRSPRPYDRNGEPVNPSQMFVLNRELMQWAYRLTKDVPLLDRPDLEHRRSEFIGFPNAQKKPFVLIGSHISDSTFWHGERMTEFGNDWVRFWTEGKGDFTTKAMEDSGTLQSLRNLSNAGKVDFERVMILRTAANYTTPSPGMTAAESLSRARARLSYTSSRRKRHSALVTPSFRNCYEIGISIEMPYLNR